VIRIPFSTRLTRSVRCFHAITDDCPRLQPERGEVTADQPGDHCVPIAVDRPIGEGGSAGRTANQVPGLRLPGFGGDQKDFANTGRGHCGFGSFVLSIPWRWAYMPAGAIARNSDGLRTG